MVRLKLRIWRRCSQGLNIVESHRDSDNFLSNTLEVGKMVMDETKLERKAASKHTVLLDAREKISIMGVLDVISFDEEEILCETEKGMLILKGYNLRVKKINLDNGELSVESDKIISITYEDNVGVIKGKSSIFNKIFK